MSDFAIHLCVHCGERCKGKYCNDCSTKAGRDKLTQEQKELELERANKLKK